MKSLISVSSFLLLITLCNLSLAENEEKKTEIYKWIDQNGRIHYAAQPGDKSAKKMHFSSRTFHDTKKQKIDKQRDSERAKLCKDARDTLKKYKKAPFLYRYDKETKQKVRLTKKESKDTFLQAEKDVSYWCNPPRDDDMH